MEDIAPTLLDEVRKVFKQKTQKDSYIVDYLEKLKLGMVDFNDTQLYAKRLGELLGNTFVEVLKEEVLPDGKLYWNIAERVIKPMLENNHELVSIASMGTQQVIDLKDNIGLKPLKPKIPNERIKGFLDNVTVDDLAFIEVQKRMYAPTVNITESFFDDFIKTNANFRYKSGLNPVIIRTLKGLKPCKWCKSLEGIYDYGTIGFNSDVFRRHENCHCQVIYKTSKYKQDVWTKKISENNNISIEKNENKFNNIVEDIIIPKSVGASGKNYPVKLLNGGYAKFATGTSITKIKAIAGKDTSTPIRDALYLENEYKIKADEWSKMRGDAYIIENGEMKHVEVHWYEARYERVKMKVKRYFEDES